MENQKYVISSSSETETNWIEKKLDEFNRKKLSIIGKPQETQLNYVIKEQKNNLIIAGIKSCLYLGEVLTIEVLFVDDTYRQTGLGKYLLNQVENEAKNMGARLVHLYTFDQTKDFYLKLGYEIFATLENCPKIEHNCYFLKKNLI